MQLTKHIGCLLALVFATASAFAADWFTADLAGVGTSPWSAAPAGWELVETGVYKFNDWNNELVYTATAANTTESNSVIKTVVQFTAMDKADFFVNDAPQAAPTGAKAGLTIVEDSDANPVTTKFYGIVNGAWAELTGNPSAALDNAVEVKVEIAKVESVNCVKYTVNNVELALASGGSMVADTDDFEISEVSYKGCVPALSALVGFAYGNTAAAKEEVVIENPGTGVPPTIDYNPADLADRGVDVTSAAAVKAYLTGEQKNHLLGWVNTTLGLDDDQSVAVASNICAKGSVTADFGFIPDGNSTIKYVVEGEEKPTAQISTAETGIKSVTVKVEQGETEVVVKTVDVGVMNTGKDVSELPADVETTYDIIAVPFEGFGGQVTVATLLNTAELTDGDTLYVLRNGQYNTYKWNNKTDVKGWTTVGGKAYTRGGSATGEVKTAETETLTPGEAVWLEHAKDSKIVIAGVGETDQDHKVTVKAGEYNLIANPTINGFDLASAEFGAKDDMIIVEDVADPVQYQYVAGQGWGKWVTKDSGKTDRRGNAIMETVFVPASEGTGTCIIPAGIGFWYKSAGTADIEIDFGKNIAK